MIYLEMEKPLFDVIQSRLPEVCPNIEFSLIATDEALQELGLRKYTLCVVGFDLDAEGFKKMMCELEQIEVDAFNTPDGKPPKSNDPDYQRYLTYGILWDILYNAHEIEYTAQ